MREWQASVCSSFVEEPKLRTGATLVSTYKWKLEPLSGGGRLQDKLWTQLDLIPNTAFSANWEILSLLCVSSQFR